MATTFSSSHIFRNTLRLSSNITCNSSCNTSASFSIHSQPFHPQSYNRPRSRFLQTQTQAAPRAGDKSAQGLSEDVTREELDDFDKAVAEDKGKQIRTPWHRQGAEVPPVKRQRSAGAMTKGKLLTTPSRLLKLILPLTTKDANKDRKDVEPLALLVHPQQPLSYLERLIQSELPFITDGKKERPPEVHFRAQDSAQETQDAKEEDIDEEDEADGEEVQGGDEMRFDGKVQRTGKISGGKVVEPGEEETERKSEPKAQAKDLAQEKEPHQRPLVESYSGLGHEATDEESSSSLPFVRWSKSTEIGDFIRDAARGQEFAVEIEGAPREIRVGCPSFSDRTYYLRMRLRKKAGEISRMADIKRECDQAAHQSAQRVAYAGFGAMAAWGAIVTWLTFMTSLGWDVMEPVTYLVGLAGIMIGYGWFLLNRREVSYKAAMNLTVSRRQSQLYEQKGFDLTKWQHLVEEGNALRNEIKAIANEYDVDWNEAMDAKDKKVIKVLKAQRDKNSKGKDDKKDGEEDDD